MRFVILTLLLILSGCGVTPKPDVQTTGSKKNATKDKNSATTVAACTAETCQAVKLKVVASPLDNGILKGYLGQPVNWQFSLDSNGFTITRGVGVYLSGPPQSWPGGIPNQLGQGTFSVLVRDLERCNATEKDKTVCPNVAVSLPNYDGKGTFSYQILQPTGVASAAPTCPSSGAGMVIGGIASMLNPLAFIPVAIVSGLINSGSPTGC